MNSNLDEALENGVSDIREKIRYRKHFKKVPVKGNTYHFFDDGKISPARHHIATVEDVFTFEEGEHLFVNAIVDYDYDRNKVVYDKVPLSEVWQKQMLRCYWLFNEDNDYFIKCTIPTYDKDPIYFCRDKGGGWFSLDVTNTWQGGQLDVNEELYERFKEANADLIK